MNIARQPHFDRRTRTEKEIKQLIAERNNVLAQFYQLSNHVNSHELDDLETLKDLLQEFCQDMIDYIATGHFEIYRRIEEGNERREELLSLSEKAFQRIMATTKVAINFNDIYDLSDNFTADKLRHFSTQLSELGENLAERIDLEDRFINTLLTPKPRLAYSAAN